MAKKSLNERREHPGAKRIPLQAKKSRIRVRPTTIRDHQYQSATSRVVVHSRKVNVEALVDSNVEAELVQLFRNAHPSCIRGGLTTIAFALIANKGQPLSPTAFLDAPDEYYMSTPFVDSLYDKLFGIRCNTCIKF